METQPYETLVSATLGDYQKHVLENDLLRLLKRGEVGVGHYVAYLRETYHLVRHTSRALALAASRIEDDQRGLRAWLLEQANEEHGHELFCLRDLRNLGLIAEEVVTADPGPGAWSLVTQNYFLATRGHPAAILGVASATEQMGAELAGALSVVVSQQLSIESSSLTFLRSHASFDVRHLEEARKAINEFATDDVALRQVILARRYTFRYYGQLFNDVAAIGKPMPMQLVAA